MVDGMTLIDENKKMVFKYKRKQFQSSILFGLKYIQTPSLLLAQSNEGDSTPEIKFLLKMAKVNLNEPFRWENTRYKSLKKEKLKELQPKQ